MDVKLKLVTVTKRFSVGTEDGDFTFSIDNAAGFHVEQKSKSTEVTFKDVPPGDYVARAEKLGIEASASFTVEDTTPPAEGPDIEVPSEMTVEVSEASTTARKSK